jgi:putative SOS response-associated peptidase YedK
MCGRYVSVKSRADLIGEYNAVRAEGPELPESYNVAPQTLVYAVLDRAEPEHPEHVERMIHSVKWGLVPSWSRDPKIGNRLVNARVETLATKPSWRTAYKKRRCVIPAAGYYEWQPVEEEGSKGTRVVKQPYYLHPADGGTLSFAGLYEWWPDPAKDKDDPERWLWSAVIITTDAHGPAGEIHDRTPVMLPADRIDAWLDPARTDNRAVGEVLAGIEPPALQIRTVSRDVNKVANNVPQLLDPLPDEVDRPLQRALA